MPQGQIRSAADPKLAEQLGGSGITRRRNTKVFEELADLMAEGKINAHLRRTYSMDDAAQAVADVAGVTIKSGQEFFEIKPFEVDVK